MTDWKLSSECDENLPLPPTSSFTKTFQKLDSKSNSFYILDKGGDYIQCGGSHDSCTVELRECKPDGTFRHYVFYRIPGSDKPTHIPMSAGGVIRQEKHSLTSKIAVVLFECFYAGKPWPEGLALEDITSEFD